MKRLIYLCVILLSGLILLGACNVSEAELDIEASPTPFIVEGVNLSLVGNTGRPQFIYTFAKW